MADNFILLNCPNCGAKLDIYDDMERFACSYCRSEMIVQRRGGTVALREIQSAIKGVQVGTDRTAAELALVRLEKELHELLRLEYATYTAPLPPPQPGVPPPSAVPIVVTFILSCVAIPFVAASLSLSGEVFFFLMVCVLFGPSGFACCRYVQKDREYRRHCDASRRAQMDARSITLGQIHQQVEKVRAQIVTNRQVLEH